jgi:hypothetical protein
MAIETLGNITSTNFAPPRASASVGPDGSNPNKIWLPLWSGETMHAYDQYNVFENIVTHKSLTGGFSYEFPITGTVGLNESWDAGEELGGTAGSSYGTSSFKVNLDNRPMAAHFETDNVDALITQYDYRSELARQAGQTLANTRDRQLAEAICVAGLLSPLGHAHTTGTLTSANQDPRGLLLANFPAPAVVGTTVAGANNYAVTNCTEATALNILQAIENYFVFMQENDYPTNNVYCVVTPKVFQVIRALGIPRSAFSAITNTGVVGTASVVAATNNYMNNPLFTGNDTFNAGMGIGMGMNALTDSLDYMGCRIIKSNHLPNNKDYATNKIGSTKYNLKWNDDTCPDIFGAIFQPEAIAGLSLMGMKVDTVADVRRNTQFTVASLMKGTGIIRPELCQVLVGINNGGAGSDLASGDIDARPDVFSIINTASSSNLANGFGAEYAMA